MQRETSYSRVADPALSHQLMTFRSFNGGLNLGVTLEGWHSLNLDSNSVLTMCSTRWNLWLYLYISFNSILSYNNSALGSNCTNRTDNKLIQRIRSVVFVLAVTWLSTQLVQPDLSGGSC